ncbi:quinone-modifying oxidoreductase, subunit QmoB [Candidatus Magnetomoraceae bacterium gMMP-15]
MDKKYGFYVCSGCGIGDAVDIDKILDVPGEEGYSICKSHPFLCGKEGVELIKKDIADEGVNTIVIAGCSRRVNFDVFNFDGCIVERTNLREQAVWSHPRPDGWTKDTGKDDDEYIDHLQMMVEDYMRMSMAKVEKIDLPEPYKLETFTRKILVIGGGITGMSAALDASKAGYEVTIVEKESALGGYAAKVRKQLPTQAPYDCLLPPIVEDKIKEVEADSKISIKTGTLVARIAGQPGEFTVTFKKPGDEIAFDVPFPVPPEQCVDEKGNELDKDQIYEIYKEINKGREDILTLDPDGEPFGAVILAAGWRPYKPEEGEFENLGYGASPDVITNVDFEKIAASGNLTRPSDGKEAKSVVFIQSPGGGDDSDFPYCGSVTSMVALKQAKYVREDYNDDGKAYVFYQHMRTPGLIENFYKSMQQDPGIFLTKGEVTSVSKSGDSLLIDAANTLLGENIQVKADLVVLGTGMVPVTNDDPVVNLAYRQGPGFRDIGLFDNYVDSNFICFPYETQRTGIYAAGAIRRSLTMEESMEDAAGAALKAIQCLESSNRGVSVHPRSGDMTFPDFFFQRCTQCKRCTEECPFGALDDDEKGTPKPNPTRCRRCGTCMGACPERIIGFADYSIDSVGSMVKVVGVPTEDDYDDPPLRIIAFICENDAYPAMDMAGINRLTWSENVRFVPVRCLGSCNTVWVKDALSVGVDGVIYIGCKHGDDYQCHFVKGSELANVRKDKISDALKSLALEEERVTQVELAIDDYYKLPEIINGFVEEIEALGPNPFKGF